MCNIIQVNVNISNAHWRWKSIWVIKGNTSVSQVSGKLQIVQVGERFELTHQAWITPYGVKLLKLLTVKWKTVRAQRGKTVLEILRFNCTSVTRRLWPRVAQDVHKISLHSSMCKMCARLYSFPLFDLFSPTSHVSNMNPFNWFDLSLQWYKFQVNILQNPRYKNLILKILRIYCAFRK